jgi:hypothetical protein
MHFACQHISGQHIPVSRIERRRERLVNSGSALFFLTMLDE